MSICPLCKHEHFEGMVDVVTDKVITRGKNKGFTKKVIDYAWKSIGDELFKEVRVLSYVSLSNSGLDNDYNDFLCCPKCGIVFKDRS